MFSMLTVGPGVICREKRVTERLFCSVPQVDDDTRKAMLRQMKDKLLLHF